MADEGGSVPGDLESTSKSTRRPKYRNRLGDPALVGAQALSCWRLTSSVSDHGSGSLDQLLSDATGGVTNLHERTGCLRA
jgi:hypothetical protein